ncbi:glycosyltransferase family 2 protein [Flavobacterium sp. KACC 22763]|uniref:glycosyltransferase family 2 protein n=1 Tax=Flavobacterium sp. KACC 22763 TaxID=3025668 RepID=UPI0023662F62|nr:glycosyltransferase family 2 protein [Flavobacterium sp. KACC 22763]WDF62876.1 glycosyltransferase family 2 protein [Flavobacterium sp. KACC 22763]
MLFSILIANFNNGDFFKDCYTSIQNQIYQNWEVIIVDDCSTDDSVAVIKNFIKNDTRFKLYINPVNRGCGFTKKRCAELAEGEILGFLDPDDAITTDALQIMVEKHKANRDIALITSKYNLVDLNMNFESIGSHGGSLPSGKSYLTYGMGALTAFATFKKEFYLKTSTIDPKMKRAVDQDLYYKLEEQGKHLFIDKALYYYRIHENSISANQNLYKAQYWHFYAMVKAFERRIKFNHVIDNFTVLEIKRLKSNYYFSRFKRAKTKNQFCVKFYFFFKSIVVFPRHNIRYKLKSLFV